jgi:CDP-diacylglycerol--serine O-phosphatidyltransferase
MTGGAPKRFSMIRSFVPADLITLANAGCGTVAIFLCLNYVAKGQSPYILAAFVLLPLALLCDYLDGMIARRQHKHSALGADLDSLADIVSFGVAPAVLGFTLGLRGVWDSIILIYFVVCGISRLARFNVTALERTGTSGKIRYFEGAPIPTSIFIVVVLAVAYAAGYIDKLVPLGSLQLGPWVLHPFTLIYAVNASLMISTIRFPKL